MTRAKSRLEKLEADRETAELEPLFFATEITPGRYQLDDGSVLDTAELEALPSSGPGLAGLIICLPEADREV